MKMFPTVMLLLGRLRIKGDVLDEWMDGWMMNKEMDGRIKDG